jgi:hypothetical protein
VSVREKPRIEGLAPGPAARALRLVAIIVTAVAVFVVGLAVLAIATA